MIEDMEANIKSSPVITEWFLWGRKVSIPLVAMLQSYFQVHKTIRLNATRYLIMKITEQKRTPTNSSKLFIWLLNLKISWSFTKVILKNYFDF